MPYLKPGAERPLKGKGSKISSKMALFVSEYMVDRNGSKAVLRAGYKCHNGSENRIATNLLRHPLVSEEIRKLEEVKREHLELTADYVLFKLMEIVEATQKENPNAALRGLELLGKKLGLYRDRQEISGPDGEAIRMEQKIKEDVDDFTRKLQRLSASKPSDVPGVALPGSSIGVALKSV